MTHVWVTDAPEVIDSTILVLQKHKEMSINIQQNQVQTQKDIEQIQKDQRDLSKHLFNEMTHKRRNEKEGKWEKKKKREKRERKKKEKKRKKKEKRLFLFQDNPKCGYTVSRRSAKRERRANGR